jgi:hypothetical protein
LVAILPGLPGLGLSSAKRKRSYRYAPCKEIVFNIPKSERMPPGGIAKARFYLVDNRLYQILSIQGGSKLSAATNQFLDSFELLYE